MTQLSLLASLELKGLFKAATEGVEKALVADMAPKGLAGYMNLLLRFMHSYSQEGAP